MSMAISKYQRTRSVQLLVEALEERNVPAIDYSALMQGINRDLGRIENVLDNNIGQSRSVLPIVNQSLNAINTKSNGDKIIGPALDVARSALTKAINALEGKPQTENAIRTALFKAVHEDAPNAKQILGDTDGDKAITKNDIRITQFNPSAGTIGLEMRLTRKLGTGKTFDFNIGLPGIPLQAKGKGQVNAGIGFDFQNLVFGLNRGNFYLGRTQNDSFRVTLDAALNSPTLNGVVGFLDFSATAGPGAATGFHGGLVVDVTRDGPSNPRLFGGADVNLTLTATFSPTQGATFPAIQSDFSMRWGFDGARADAVGAAFGSSPTVAFNNVRVGLGSFLSNMMAPVVRDLQKGLEVVEPVFAALNWPLPGLSDLSRAIAGQDISLLTAANIASSIGALPADWKAAVEVITRLNQINDIVGNINLGPDGQLYFPVGSFNLHQSNGDLRSLPVVAGNMSELLGKLQNINLKDISSLVPATLAGAKKFKDVITDWTTTLPPEVSGPINGTMENVFRELQKLENGVKLEFPLIEDPRGGIFKLLLGQDADFVRLSGKLHVTAQYERPFRLLNLMDAVFKGNVNLDLEFGVGYDTYGLRQFFIKNGDFGQLAKGFYLDTTKPLIQMSASVAAGPGITLPPLHVFFVPLPILGVVPVPVAPSFEITGGVHAENITISVRDGAVPDGRRRVFDESEGPLFSATGKLWGEFKGSILVKSPVPLIPDVTLYKKVFARKELFNLDADPRYQSNPFAASPNNPPVALPRTIDLSFTEFADDGEHDFITGRVHNGRVEVLARSATKPERVVLSYALNEITDLNITGTSDDETYTIMGHLNRKVTIQAGGGQHSLTLEDRDRADGTYTVTNRIIDRLNLRNFEGDIDRITVHYSSMDSIRLLGAASSTFNVHGTAAGVALTLEGGGLVNNYNLGSGYLQDVGGPVTIVGVGRQDALNLLDYAERVPINGFIGLPTRFVVDQNRVRYQFDEWKRVTRVGEEIPDNILTPETRIVDFSGLEMLTILGGNWQGAGSSFAVSRAPSNVQMWFQGGNGNDVFTLAAEEGASVDPTQHYSAGNLSYVSDRLFIDAGDGSDALLLNDMGNDDPNDRTYYAIDQFGIKRRVDTLNPDGVVTGAIADYQYAGFEEVRLYGANTQSNYTVTGLDNGLGFSTFTIFSGQRDDRISVAGQLTDTFRARLLLQDLGGADVLELSSAQAGYHFMTTEDIWIPFLDIVNQGGFESITLNGSPGSDQMVIDYTPVGSSVMVNGLGGDDEIIVTGDPPQFPNQPPSYYHLGPLVVNGGDGRDTLEKRGFDLADRNWKLSAGALLRDGANIFSYGGVEALKVEAGAGHDRFHIDTLSAITSLLMGEGNDIVTLGNEVNGLASLAGLLAVVGGQGGDQLLVDDTAGPPAGRAYGFLDNSLFVDFGVLALSYDIESLFLNTTGGVDAINVESVRNPTQISVNAGAGDDQFRIGSMLAGMRGILAQLNLNGQEGSDTAVFDDAANPFAEGYVANPGAIELATLNLSIAHQGLDALTILGGRGNDSFGISDHNPALVLDGGLGFNSLAAGSIVNTWQITGANSGTLNTRHAFARIHDYFGGGVGETFVFTEGASIGGSIHGLGGPVTLDYSQYASGIVVNLATGSFTGIGADDNNSVRTVIGGAGNDILIGRADTMQFFGGMGRDLLIAGQGAATLFGGEDDDLLIAGQTAYDADPAALAAILAEWAQPSDYNTRVTSLRSGSGLSPILDETTVLTSVPTNTITGASGADLFFVESLAEVVDLEFGEEWVPLLPGE